MIDPLSKIELNKIKSLEFDKYASIPIIYEKEIHYVFKEVIPRLILVAEAYSTVCDQVQTGKANVPMSEENVVILQAVLKQEDKLLRMAEQIASSMRAQHDKKKTLLALTPVSLPWYKKLWPW